VVPAVSCWRFADSASHTAGAGRQWAVHPPPHNLGVTLTAPPTTSTACSMFGIHCYQPFQLAKAYNFAPLRAAGIDGRGRTIVIVDSFGSPTIENDLHVFDQVFGLPDRPADHPAASRAVPPFRSDKLRPGWLGRRNNAGRRVAHVFAPGARSSSLKPPVAEMRRAGVPEIVRAEN